MLRAVAGIAGAAATAPLLGQAAAAQADGGGDADALFKAGEFERAGRAYEDILKKDSRTMQAPRRRGYVALLANQFPDAEKYLKTAIELAPDDKEANWFLADCNTRQDKFSLAAPHWRAAGEAGYAKLFAAFRGEPHQMQGDVARVPWRQMDPEPLLEASLNGGPPKSFTFYTRVASVGVSAEAAREAGLRAVSEEKFEYEGATMRFYSRVLGSLKLGGIELRNIPVSWSDGEARPGSSHGTIGTWLFYHFLSTIDYAGRSLILRRRTPETAAKARADAERAAAERLPLWLAPEHLLFSRSSVAGAGADSGKGVVALNIGGRSEMVASMAEETAKRLRVRTDYDRPIETSAGGQFLTAYPCYPKAVRLGNAAAHDSYCYADARPGGPGREGFDVLANFSHGFFKPYNVTLHFTDMNVYIAPGKAT